MRDDSMNDGTEDSVAQDVNTSMPRVPEPELMDDSEIASEYEQMDHAEVNRVFVDDLFQFGDPGERLIDLGCGPAHIAIEICQRDANVEVMAVDAAAEMLELARVEIDLGGMLDRIFLQQADVKAMDHFEDALADTVISNSLVHHLDDPLSLLRVAMRIVRPGGRLFLRDLVRPQSDEACEDLITNHAADATPIARQLLRQSLAAAWTVSEIQGFAVEAGLPNDCVTQTSDRHWTLAWQKPPGT